MRDISRVDISGYLDQNFIEENIQFIGLVKDYHFKVLS